MEMIDLLFKPQETKDDGLIRYNNNNIVFCPKQVGVG
jgi:hypothetical protein